MWVIRSHYRSALREYYSYFTGAGMSQNRRGAVRFTHRHWAERTLKAIGFRGCKIVRVRRKPPHRCKCACCPCLVVS
jgi:hypothetical protein